MLINFLQILYLVETKRFVVIVNMLVARFRNKFQRLNNVRQITQNNNIEITSAYAGFIKIFYKIEDIIAQFLNLIVQLVDTFFALFQFFGVLFRQPAKHIAINFIGA